MRLPCVENGKFQIAVKGCCYDWLPRHVKTMRANNQGRLIRINIERVHENPIRPHVSDTLAAGRAVLDI
jgi:hypothetical protein